uniref:Uncharacterized protein n=1 Tax=Neobacillus citreus TaxID=2833578 RepID=A0A942T6D4_9BACI
MKKLTSLFLAAMLLFLVSCSAEKTDKQPKETEKTKSEAVNVDKGLLSVTITLPASMFEDQNVDEVVANAQKDGITATKNADGSVTYKMSKSKLLKLLNFAAILFS